MLISLNWIKDYVDLSGIDEEKLLNSFTLSCAEIEDVEHKGKDIKGVVSAKIVKIENHPNSKKLHLLKVNDGKKLIDVVCGAPNVKENMIVPLAVEGGQVGNMTINSAVVGGYISNGMCCSAKELGITDDNSGLLELPSNTPLGVDIKKLYAIEDTVFEVDNKSLTNRPDMWGHYGIAREISALVGRPLKKVDLYKGAFGDKKLDIKINTPLCFRYSGLSLSNLTQKISPIDMQIRLFYTGMRPINLLADITNYVMLELGQPMHAFDNSVVKNIRVEQLDKNQNFTTLDKTQRVLPSGTMVIKTNDDIVAVAGVMGGLDSEITENTTSVLIESANFDGVSVRKTATTLGLRSEASARYEKMLDPELTKTCLLRYVYLVTKCDKNAKIVSDLTDVYKYKYPHKQVTLTQDFIDTFVGIEIPSKQVVSILKSLEFGVLLNKGNYVIDVPSFRSTKDINGKQDIVEEITRIYGYDNIIPKTSMQGLKPVLLNKYIDLEYQIKYNLASRFNLNEIHSYIWYDTETNNNLKIKANSKISLVNAINKENNQIRTTMIPSLLKVVNDNKNDENEIGIFEIGKVVSEVKNNLAVENSKLAIALFSKKQDESALLLKLKNIVDYLIQFVVKNNVSYKLVAINPDKMIPANSYEIDIDGKACGNLSPLYPSIKNNISPKCAVVTCEMDFDMLVSCDEKKTQFEKVSRYPKTILDFNFLLSKDMLYENIQSIANSIKTTLEYRVELLDIYENNDSKSYTLRYELFSYEKTLTGNEIEDFHKLVINTFAKNGINLKA